MVYETSVIVGLIGEYDSYDESRENKSRG